MTAIHDAPRWLTCVATLALFVGASALGLAASRRWSRRRGLHALVDNGVIGWIFSAVHPVAPAPEPAESAEPPPPSVPAAPRPPLAFPADPTPSAAPRPPPAGYVRPRHTAWAELLRRSFGLDVLACPDCGGRLRLVATIADARVIARILTHLGLPREPPRPAPPRQPSWLPAATT
jgi:hypothetical protein